MKSPLPFVWPPNQQNQSERARWSSALQSVGNGRVPYPPRNVRVTSGTLKLTVTWDAPEKDAQYVTGYRVFLNTESNLVREISDPTTRTVDIAVTDTENHNVFVAAVNASKKQSRPVRTYGLANRVSGLELGPLNNGGVMIGTNPLSQSGTTKTILIGSRTWQFSFGQRTYNSDTVTPPDYGTWHVYHKDPTYKGGAVTYYYSANYSDTWTDDGILYDGKIATAAGGGGTGSGGGSGGGRNSIL